MTQLPQRQPPSLPHAAKIASHSQFVPWLLSCIRPTAMRRGLNLVLFLSCLNSSGCGSPATRDALVQAAVVTAVVAGEIATAAARDAAAQEEAKRLRRQQAASQSNINQWRLVRRYESDDDSDESDPTGESDDDSTSVDADSVKSDTAESSDPDLPVGRCMVCG